jgi:hypothetical protein
VRVLPTIVAIVFVAVITFERRCKTGAHDMHETRADGPHDAGLALRLTATLLD